MMHWQHPEPSRSSTKIGVLRSADVVRPPLEVDRLVLVLKPLLDLDFRESEGRFFRHSQVVFDLSLFRSNMSLTENESVVL